jgi:ABC-type multidrug transport system permease subunit
LIVATMLLLGSGLGPSSMSFLVAAQNAVSWQQRGVVTAASQFFRSMSGTVGVAALGAVLSSGLVTLLPTVNGVKLNPNGLLNRAVRASLSPTVLHSAQVALANGLHRVFVLMALFAACAFLRVIQIVRRRADAEPAHQSPVESGEEAIALALAE